MKMTEKENKVLGKYFSIHESKSGNDIDYELEDWTSGGVDMIIRLSINDDRSITEQFKEYGNNFDIDEEIDVYRQDRCYRSAFTIRESVEDFESWVEHIRDIINELENE